MENEIYIKHLEGANKRLFQKNSELKDFVERVFECSQELSDAVLSYGLDGDSDALHKKSFVISNRLTVYLDEVKNGC
jgi:hypothetical protein